MTKNELKAKWEELNEQWEDLEKEGKDPNEIYNEWLEENGLVDEISMQCHWGDGGAFDAIDGFIELLKKPEILCVFENPRCEGTDFCSWSVFKCE
jgi:hypothetical protein